MRDVLSEPHGDRVESAPPKGKGASLTVRYVLPRLRNSAVPAPASTTVEVAAPQGPRHVHPEFLDAVEALHGKFERLNHMAPVKVKPDNLPEDAPSQGIYLFSEGARPMYVGRTRNPQRRVGNHCGGGARETTGKPKATYTADGSRSALMNDQVFAAAFTEAKQRVRRMDLRYVAETDPLRQALLEMYVAVILKTPYNDFDTN